MGWRFRKSFSPIPGVRLTLSPSGVSTSVGFGPFRASTGPGGSAFTTRIPGTGLSFRESVPASGGSGAGPTPEPELHPYDPWLNPQLQEIGSSGSVALTTAGLSELQDLLKKSFAARESISQDLAPVREEQEKLAARVKKWDSGFLFKKLFRKKLDAMRIRANELTDERAELEEQWKLSKLTAEIDVPPAVTGAYERLCLAFSSMASSQGIWDTVGERATNKIAERTAAGRVVERKPVKFSTDVCALLDSLPPAPHMHNANGGDIYLFPAFIVYLISRERFALLEYREVRMNYAPTGFMESDGIPSDAERGESVWAKTNKNGTPDKRFKDNYQIPVAIYGKFSLTSDTGLREEYMVSKRESCEKFTDAWARFTGAVWAGD